MRSVPCGGDDVRGANCATETGRKDTANLVAEHLNSLGFDEVKTGVGGLWFNHSPNFYWNDSSLQNGVRLHNHVTYDFLTGKI